MNLRLLNRGSSSAPSFEDRGAAVGHIETMFSEFLCQGGDGCTRAVAGHIETMFSGLRGQGLNGSTRAAVGLIETMVAGCPGQEFNGNTRATVGQQCVQGFLRRRFTVILERLWALSADPFKASSVWDLREQSLNNHWGPRPL